jgi:hypothetical protein
MRNFFYVAGLAFLLLFSSQAFAQFEKGDKLLNLGIGLGTYGAGGLGFGGSFEIGITNDISVGALGAYSGTNYFGSRFSVLSFGARGSYHFNNLLDLGVPELDLYGGLGIGYRTVSWDGFGGTQTWGSGVFLLAHVGARYYFNEKIGAYAELGSSFGIAQLGLAIKF